MSDFFEGKTHYEVLELRRDAGPEEVERSYRLAAAAYAGDSLAAYSIYDEQELEEIRRRIGEAYRVLSDTGARAIYDAELGDADAGDGPGPAAPPVDVALELEGIGAPPQPRTDSAPAQAAAVEEDDGDAEGGELLRRRRCARGIEIDQIADSTKINPTYLRCIEEERFEYLPAEVYVRGFVISYARCVGLDPKRIVGGFMDRMMQTRQQNLPLQSARSGRR